MMTTTIKHCETCGQQMLPTDYWQRKAQEIENAAYERAAEICDTWSGYKTYQGDAQGACDDCAAAIRALKK
jgi:7-cyano-7-deazaguanine synthase in queuosine biosynthesis